MTSASANALTCWADPGASEAGPGVPFLGVDKINVSGYRKGVFQKQMDEQYAKQTDDRMGPGCQIAD